VPRKVIIDADPGIGDAIAIALAMCDPEIDLVGLTPTAGCVSGKDATRNAQVIVELLDCSKWPRLGECEVDVRQVGRNVSGDEALNLMALNGNHGLGDLEFAVSDLHNRRECAKLLIDMVKADPHEITLLTLGPLTNVEMAVERAPDFLSLLKGIVCLGGSVQVGGDVTPSAEFNMYVNPQAARSVLGSSATKMLVPLDVSQKAVLTFDQYDRLKPSGRLGELFSHLFPYAFRAHHEQLGLEGIRLQEVVALSIISRPRLFSSRTMAVDVETSGELTRGMTVFDRRIVQRWQKNVGVVTEIDAQGVIDYFSEVVRRAG
jgi:inosine-uridine nucleoside N-ribohydrolase